MIHETLARLGIWLLDLSGQRAMVIPPDTSGLLASLHTGYVAIQPTKIPVGLDEARQHLAQTLTISALYQIIERLPEPVTFREAVFDAAMLSGMNAEEADQISQALSLSLPEPEAVA